MFVVIQLVVSSAMSLLCNVRRRGVSHGLQDLHTFFLQFRVDPCSLMHVQPPVPCSFVYGAACAKRRMALLWPLLRCCTPLHVTLFRFWSYAHVPYNTCVQITFDPETNSYCYSAAYLRYAPVGPPYYNYCAIQCESKGLRLEYAEGRRKLLSSALVLHSSSHAPKACML